MHAFLITGGTKEKRLEQVAVLQKEWRVSSFDRIALEPIEGTIGIAAARDFQKQLIIAPYGSPVKMGIISDAQQLTPEAQNALLKTLEEPPPHTQLVLEAPTSDMLLPTITSRCHVIHLKETKEQSEDATSVMAVIDKIIQAPIAKRIELIDEISKTRDEAKQWVSGAIAAVRKTMLEGKEGNAAKILRSLLTAQNQLSANVTPKLVLDNLFLSFKPRVFLL
mgnify:FL=1